MLITLEPHGIFFYQILHTYASQHCLTTGMRNSLFDGQGFSEHQSGQSWSVSKMPIALEPHGVFESVVVFYSLFVCILLIGCLAFVLGFLMSFLV